MHLARAKKDESAVAQPWRADQAARALTPRPRPPNGVRNRPAARLQREDHGKVAVSYPPSRPRGIKLQKWEYATVPLISHALQEILNQWGEEGWELVQIVESSTTGTVGYLKRPKGEPPAGAGSDISG